MKRFALLSDIHGNSVALDAVLADAAAGAGVDGFWVLGDLAAIGADPVGVLERVTALPNVRVIRGNADRYLVTGERPPPAPEDALNDLAQVRALVDVAGTLAWTQGMITVGGWLEWLADLPLEMREVLPDGTRFLGVHAAPGTDDNPNIHPGLSEEELRSIVAESDADLVCVGHTHWPLDIRIDGIHIVNLGSVSNPWAPDTRASYVFLEADEQGYEILHKRVDYDREAVINALQRLRHPGAPFITSMLRGERKAPWQ